MGRGLLVRWTVVGEGSGLGGRGGRTRAGALRGWRGELPAGGGCDGGDDGGWSSAYRSMSHTAGGKIVVYWIQNNECLSLPNRQRKREVDEGGWWVCIRQRASTEQEDADL